MPGCKKTSKQTKNNKKKMSIFYRGQLISTLINIYLGYVKQKILDPSFALLGRFLKFIYLFSYSAFCNLHCPVSTQVCHRSMSVGHM